MIYIAITGHLWRIYRMDDKQWYKPMKSGDFPATGRAFGMPLALDGGRLSGFSGAPKRNLIMKPQVKGQHETTGLINIDIFIYIYVDWSIFSSNID